MNIFEYPVGFFFLQIWQLGNGNDFRMRMIVVVFSFDMVKWKNCFWQCCPNQALALLNMHLASSCYCPGKAILVLRWDSSAFKWLSWTSGALFQPEQSPHNVVKSFMKKPEVDIGLLFVYTLRFHDFFSFLIGGHFRYKSCDIYSP